MRDVIDFLKMNDVKYIENALLSRFSSVRIGGHCSVVAFPKDKEQLIFLVHFLWNNKTRYKILGRMSNVLPPDDKYKSVVIKTDLLRDIYISENTVVADVGISLPVLARNLADSGLSGTEELSGIPGSLGGAIFGNAGAFGREISDLVKNVEIYDPEKDTFETLSHQNAEFIYRGSLFTNKHFVILSATLDLCARSSDEIRSRMEHFLSARKQNQPSGEPSLGSVFKRPYEDLSAAQLIDRCGLKGYSIGGATVSEKHAGFIVNKGGATSKDYLDLANCVEDRVYEKFGIKLQKEIEIL